MILHRLLWRFARHRDDAEFYRLQATDAVRWLRTCGVQLGPGVQVLDLGCGHGVFGRELLGLGCAVTFADEANYLFPECQLAPFHAINLDRDPLESLDSLGRYDLVIFSNVLEHLRHPKAFLAQADRLLAPGGKFYLSWTNWLSPWGGHEYSPLHYLGAGVGPWLFERLKRKTFHRPGENLFRTYIGEILKHIRAGTRLQLLHGAPRYFTELPWVIRIPILREFLTWNCGLLLGLK